MEIKERGGILILIANLMVLGMMLKLYTEVFKDKAFDKRANKGPLPEEDSCPVHEGRPRH